MNWFKVLRFSLVHLDLDTLKVIGINIQLIISILTALIRQPVHKCAPNTLPPLVGATFTLPSFARSTSSSIEVTNLPQVSAAEHVKSCRDMSRRAHNAPQLN